MDWRAQSRQGTLLLIVLFCSARFISPAAAQLTADNDSECGPLISFFPDGHEDTNIPLAWGKSAQMAAGNFAKDVMFTIALPSIVNVPGTEVFSKPMLQLQPVHELLKVGSNNIPNECMGYDDSGSRKLLQIGGSSSSNSNSNSSSSSSSSSTAGNNTSSNSSNTADNSSSSSSSSRGTAASPQGREIVATLRQQAQPDVDQDTPASTGQDSATLMQHTAEQQAVTVHQNQQEPELSLLYPARFKVQYQFNNSALVDLGEYTDATYLPKIVLDLQEYPDDYYCLTVQVTILPWTGLMMPGSVAVPVKPLISTKQVCFYKMDGVPTAQASFNTCSSESFAVAVSNIHPFPIPLYPGSDEPFWYPVAHFKTELNRTGDYHWPPNEAKTSLEQWIIAADTSQPFVWTPEERLYEGWYNIHLDVSLTTPFPTLMAVGLNSVTTYNDTTAPDVIKGWYKYLAMQQYPPGTVRGVQHQLSRYRSMEGPSELSIPLHTEVPFTWEFDGFGDTYCFVDGKLKHNWGDDQCTPPFNVMVPDRKTHTLKVVRKDVCGKTLAVVSSFGAWGYSITQVPKDLYEDLATAEGYDDNTGLIFESAPLQPTNLRRSTPQRVQANNGRALTGPSMQVAWSVLLLVLLLQLACG